MAEGGAYLLGHTDREQRRLAGQAALIGPDTEALFRKAGLGPGMSVLDVGSGLGDVALLAGKLVSPGGRVLGIERSMEGIAIAKQRATAFPNIDVRFELADLDAYEPQQTFDALVGRFALSLLPGHLKGRHQVEHQQQDVHREQPAQRHQHRRDVDVGVQEDRVEEAVRADDRHVQGEAD